METIGDGDGTGTTLTIIFILSMLIFILVGIVTPIIYQVQITEPPGIAKNTTSRNIFAGVGLGVGCVGMFISGIMKHYYNKTIASLD